MTNEAPGAIERQLAGFAATLDWQAIPPAVRHEAKRSILNIVGTAFSGCQEAAVTKALHAHLPYSGKPAASLIGRQERADPPLAAFLNAMAANIFDYDDNHAATIIHPSAPLAPALLAWAEAAPTQGADLLRAFVIGGEIECRIGNALSPYHYAHGWHITSTAGIFGAGFGVGALLRLPEAGFVATLGNAAVQSAGLVEALGTMSKSISVGNAARQGMMSALLARDGFTGPPAPLTGARGFLRVYGDAPKLAALTDGLGADWEIGRNTYKPYPAGVVLNPVIDAALELAARPGFKPDRVQGIALRGHPLLRERTDRPDVMTGREAQVSAQHAIAVALADGAAGLDAFSDAAVARTAAAGRPTLTFIDDPSYPIAAVDMTVTLTDGEPIEAAVRAARGSAENPMTDSDLEAKLKALAQRAAFTGDVNRLIDAVWTLDTAEDAGAIMRLAAARP